MFRLISYKIFYAALTLFGVLTVIFFLFNVLPGDPARMMLGQNENSDQIQIIKKKYGFDKPLTTQYLYYLNDVSPISFHSNNSNAYTYFSENKYSGVVLFSVFKFSIAIKQPYLRMSFTKPGKPVIEIIKETMPNTVVLALASIVIAIILGLSMGIFSALCYGSWIDKTIQLISTIGMSLPSFFSAILFAWIFGFLLHEFTGLKMTGSLYEVDDFGEYSYRAWKNLVLPAFVLGIRPIAVFSQLMRNALLEVLNQDYIRTAKSKGLSPFKIIYKHALKNALNPVITAVSGWFASMLAGAVFVEYIFGWNGLGKEIVNALNTLDLPVIMGAVLTIALTFILINIIVDIIYAQLDPKIKF